MAFLVAPLMSNNKGCLYNPLCTDCTLHLPLVIPRELLASVAIFRIVRKQFLQVVGTEEDLGWRFDPPHTKITERGPRPFHHVTVFPDV